MLALYTAASPASFSRTRSSPSRDYIGADEAVQAQSISDFIDEQRLKQVQQRVMSVPSTPLRPCAVVSCRRPYSHIAPTADHSAVRRVHDGVCDSGSRRPYHRVPSHSQPRWLPAQQARRPAHHQSLCLRLGASLVAPPRSCVPAALMLSRPRPCVVHALRCCLQCWSCFRPSRC